MPLPPGSHQPLAMVSRFARDPLELLLHVAEEHGGVASLPLGPRPVQRLFVVVSEPGPVRDVLQRHDDRYRKAFTYEPLRRFLGDGLLTSEGERWARHRRLAQPFFGSARVRALVPAFAASCDRLLARWEVLAAEGRPVDVGEEMRRLTLDIVGRTLFGVELSATTRDVGAAIEVLQQLALRHAFSIRTWMGWTWLPRRTPRRQAEALASLDRIVGDLVERRRRHPGEHDDLLAGLLAAGEAEGTVLSQDELRDQLVTFLAAGHETTANALAWTWFLLGGAPEVRRRLLAEVDAVLGDGTPRAEDVDALRFTAAVLAEALRLYPPAWTIERDAVRDDVLGGYDIPAGTTVMASPWVLHRRSTLWDDPLAFDPDRFLDDRSAGRDRFAYLPFGAGRRQCIGQGFALLEGTLAVAMLARRFHLELLPDQRVEPDPRITLGMRRPLRARLLAREAHRPVGTVRSATSG
jgi:cytochrome P450